ncbi:LLM class oxidoreductase, partial [Mesorhizobium sp. M8A.F.Ca.ET.173.01.1.1]
MTTIQTHSGFQRTFQQEHLTLGLMLPFDDSENIALPIDQQIALVQYAE